jgi:hypothetical protein
MTEHLEHFEKPEPSKYDASLHRSFCPVDGPPSEHEQVIRAKESEASRTGDQVDRGIQNIPAEGAPAPDLPDAKPESERLPQKADGRSALEKGQDEHSKFRDGILENDPRAEGPNTFTTEKAITDPEGNVVRDNDGHYGRPDYVDYEDNLIVDVKPIHEGESLEDVYAEHQDQLDTYENLYELGRDVSPDIQIATYPADEEI